MNKVDPTNEFVEFLKTNWFKVGSVIVLVILAWGHVEWALSDVVEKQVEFERHEVAYQDLQLDKRVDLLTQSHETIAESIRELKQDQKAAAEKQEVQFDKILEAVQQRN